MLPSPLRPVAAFEDQPGEPGQVLADVLKTRIAVAEGILLAVPGADGVEERTLTANGQLRWNPFATHFAYQPRLPEGEATAPFPARYRAPFDGLIEIGPGQYRLGSYAVLELTRSGLWLRPPTPDPATRQARAVPRDPSSAKLLFSASNADEAALLGQLAREAHGRLSSDARQASRILPFPPAGRLPGRPTGTSTISPVVSGGGCASPWRGTRSAG
jgi:hypothetical protein